MWMRCIQTENKKIKHSYIWLACLLIPVIPSIMGTFNFLQNLGVLQKNWNSLWTQISLFYSNLFYAPLIALYGAYLWRLEHQNHNWNLLKSCPVSVAGIYLGKLFVILKATLLTQLWLGLLFFLAGKGIGLPGLLPKNLVLYLLRGTAAGLTVGALQLLFSLLIQSFALPIGAALLGSVMGFFLLNKDMGLLWPYALMLLGMNSNGRGDLSNMENLWFFISVFAFFLFFSLLNLILLKTKE